jgi:hypothetical protein
MEWSCEPHLKPLTTEAKQGIPCGLYQHHVLECYLHDIALSELGLSTVPYTATAILLTVSIWPQAIPYLSHIHMFESPHRYGTVVATAGIRVRMVVRDKVA